VGGDGSEVEEGEELSVAHEQAQIEGEAGGGDNGRRRACASQRAQRARIAEGGSRAHLSARLFGRSATQ
jgi:hypothetical protein